MITLRHRPSKGEMTPDSDLARHEGWYPAAIVEQALAEHSRTNISPRNRDLVLYKSFGFSRMGLGIHATDPEVVARVIASVFDDDAVSLLMEGVEELESRYGHEKTAPLTEALLRAHSVHEPDPE